MISFDDIAIIIIVWDDINTVDWTIVFDGVVNCWQSTSMTVACSLACAAHVSIQATSLASLI